MTDMTKTKRTTRIAIGITSTTGFTCCQMPIRVKSAIVRYVYALLVQIRSSYLPTQCVILGYLRQTRLLRKRYDKWCSRWLPIHLATE